MSPLFARRSRAILMPFIRCQKANNGNFFLRNFNFFKPRIVKSFGGQIFASYSTNGNRNETEKPTGDEKSESQDNGPGFVPFGIFGCAGLVGLGYYVSGLIQEDPTAKNMTLSQFLDRTSQSIFDWLDSVFPNSGEPLLPDFKQLNYPPNLPTLVVDLDKVVAKLEYDRKVGWQVKKRPYADLFFKELVNYYELVIWSDDSYPMATDVANRWGLPVIGCIHRDQCKPFKGGFIKDLSRLGRNLKRVILLDHDKVACMLQESNAIIIKEFDGDESDKELLYLVDLLKAIAVNPQDVRVQLKQFGGGDDFEIGKRFAAKASQEQEKAKNRMNISKKLGFKHF